MQKNKNIMFLTGDLGFNALEPLQKEFPDSFVNVGIAEANMAGIAAGLALAGKKVIIYSIASFVTMRAYEQIRDDICYHNLDVKVIGTGGGYNYGNHGVTHHTVEDVAIMSALPNMKVFSPGYSWEASECTAALLKDVGPAYLRLGKSPGKDYSKLNFSFQIGETYTLKEGKDLVLLATGNILDYALETAELVKKETGLDMRVVSVPTIKPLDTKAIVKMATGAKLIATLEEHSLYGGLASQVGMALAEAGVPTRLVPFGIPDAYIKTVGSRGFLLKEAGLDPAAVSKKIIWNLKKQK